MKTVTVSRNVADPLRFMKKLQERGISVLGVANPNHAGATHIQVADNQDENAVRTAVSAIDCGTLVLECPSPRGLMGCRAVKADGVAKHLIVITKRKENGSPCTAPAQVCVVPSTSVPLSAVKITMTNGVAEVEVGPMSTPLMLMVHVVDASGNMAKHGMELSFEP
jgi:hypothetical protein